MFTNKQFPRLTGEFPDWFRQAWKALTDYHVSLNDRDGIEPTEFGHWTPTLTFATAGDLSVTYTTRLGRYTKIGKDVRAEFVIQTSGFTHTTASGNCQITGLPFTAATDSGMVWQGPLLWQGITKANYTNVVTAVSSGSSLITLNASGSGQSAVNIASGDMPTGGSVILRGEVTYRV